MSEKNVETKEKFTGNELMNAGILLPRHPYDFNGLMYHFKVVKE